MLVTMICRHYSMLIVAKECEMIASDVHLVLDSVAWYYLHPIHKGLNPLGDSPWCTAGL